MDLRVKPKLKLRQGLAAKPRRKLRRDLVALCFILPFAVVYTVFIIWPVGEGLYMSAYKWGLMGRQRFLAWGNYQKFLGDKFFWSSLWNTTKFVILSTPTIIVASFLLALLANRATKIRRLLRASYFAPNLLSVSVISYIAVYMLRPYGMGFVSVLMRNLGFTQELFFLKDEGLVWLSVVGTTCWWTMGYNMMLYVSALQDIPDQLYESASIDGATASRQLWSITLPLLRPTHLLILMLQLIASFKIFAQMRLITNNDSKFWTLINYIYESAFSKNNLGYGAAMSYALFLILIVLTLAQFLWSRRKEAEA